MDLEKQIIAVYDFENETVNNYIFSDKVNVGIYEDFEIDFSQISVE